MLSEEDFELEQSTFARIAEHHNEKLTRLREEFDSFNAAIDIKFDDIMKKLRQWSGYGEEDRLQFHDSSSFRTSEPDGSMLSSVTPSDRKANRVPPESIDREGNMRLDSTNSLKKGNNM